MNIQTPASHRNDPQSSHIAEQSMNKSGKRQLQQKQVQRCVQMYPGRTSAELAQLSGLDRAMIARRLPELSPRHIKRGEELVRCGVNGTQAIAWWPID